MQKKVFLFSVSLAMSMLAAAQVPTHPKYVDAATMGDGFKEGYVNWEPGKALYSDNEDVEEFFISRVKMKPRFTNANTQVDPSLSSDRKFFWWVPIGESRWNAVPSYFFNSEVFTMWSYLDHWGNWTAPILRAPAAYLDICHKNGVETSVVGSVPFGHQVGTDEGWGQTMKVLADGGYEKLLKYLRYYGIDGLGYNSEFNFSNKDLMYDLQDLIAQSHAHKSEFGVPFVFSWYSITNNSGTTSTSTSNWDSLNDGNDDWFYDSSLNQKVSNYFFCNYNWNSNLLSTSVSTAQKFAGASTYDVYAGMDMQGRSVAYWTTLQQYPISVGIWGAHNMNMLFESRGEAGTSGTTPQETYIKRSELFFTGGTQNPVNPPAISNKLIYSVNSAQAFHGISSFITARSVLQSDNLANEPFVTYFNLGNGMFFNVEGETTFGKEWYNIGIQDYMPTWRWWWTSKFMGRTDEDVPAEGLNATFTWDDAWFGGSCLKISGSAETEYLQLFKTKYALNEGDKLTIRYKVLNGNGGLAWACSAEGSETTEVAASIKGASSAAVYDEWVEKTVTIGQGLGGLKLDGKTLAMMGLKFTDAENLELLIGEISLTRGEAVTPSAPTVKKSKMMSYNYEGADMMIIFSMGDAPAANPEQTVYNSDVNTWMFKIYTQEEGQEPVMCTATTSWAAYVVGAPVADASSRMRIGVSAVSLDGKSESDITWGDYMELPEPTVSEGVEIDKPVIKANEEFTIKYSDPNHAPAVKWEIRKSNLGDDSQVVDFSEGGTSFTTSLEEEGLYDLALTFTKNENDTTEIYRGMIQISGQEVGALPQIEEIAVNEGTADVNAEKGEVVKYSYVGRQADGTVSRGLLLPDVAFGLEANQLQWDDQTPFTIAYWFRADEFNHGTEGTSLLNIRDPKDNWPANNWGFVWQDATVKNTIQTNIRATYNGGTPYVDENFVIEPGRWYHMCLVVDYKAGQGRSMELYMNGRSLGAEMATNVYSWRQTNYILFGGYAANRASFKGAIDEFQIYNKALNEEEAKASMGHFTEIPDGLVGYWDFETDADEDGYIYSTGTNKSLKAAVLTSASTGESEGATSFSTMPATFEAGAPFISGSFEVKTLPNWGLVRNAATANEVVTPTAGSVDVTYSEDGEYQATLTLSNSWGSDSKTFPLVVVEGGTGIEDASAVSTDVYPNPFENELYINFVEEGTYTVQVYGLAGNLVSEQAMSAVAGDVIRVSVNAAPGTYLVKVLNKDAETVKAVKVIKK